MVSQAMGDSLSFELEDLETEENKNPTQKQLTKIKLKDSKRIELDPQLRQIADCYLTVKEDALKLGLAPKVDYQDVFNENFPMLALQWTQNSVNTSVAQKLDESLEKLGQEFISQKANIENQWRAMWDTGFIEKVWNTIFVMRRQSYRDQRKLYQASVRQYDSAIKKTVFLRMHLEPWQ